MIVVKIELHSAVTGLITPLGKMVIANDGSSTDPGIGHYDAKVLTKPNFTRVTREAHVSQYQRANKPIWCLVSKALNAMGYK